MGRKLSPEPKKESKKNGKKPKNKKLRVCKLKILSLNIKGIKNKIMELESLIYKTDADIILIQETKRVELDTYLEWPGYKIIEKHANKNKNHNGLMFEIRKNYSTKLKSLN